MRASTLTATAFPSRLQVDAFLFAVAAMPADVVRLIISAYEFNQVAAGLVAALARVQGALFRQPVSCSFSHKFRGAKSKSLFLSVNKDNGFRRGRTSNDERNQTEIYTTDKIKRVMS